MVRRLILVLATALVTQLGWASVTASVDRTRIFSDETLVLTIRADFPAANEPLDLTALSALFEIEQQSQSTQSRYSTGGGSERWREWQLLLRPRETGTVAIPNFKLGGDQTEPIFIQVRDASERQDGLPDDAIILEAELSDTDPYVGQPITLTIRLKYQVRLQGNFDTLKLDAFEAEKLDESNTVVQEGNRQYNQYQLVYRLISDRAGLVNIPEIRFSGQYQTGQFNSARRVGRTHPGFGIQVKPIPAAFPNDADWLPAESLSLQDNLPSNLELVTHENLNWVITTRVNGLPATRLPDPVEDLQENGFRLYRNAPEFNEGEPLNSRKDMNALVFTQPGTYTLPAVRVPWWNLRTDKLEWAELPERTVTVNADPNATVTTVTPTEPVVSDTSAPARTAPGIWPWVSLSLGIGWAATVVVWVASSRRRRPAGPQRAASENRDTPDLSALKSLAREGEPAAFYSAFTQAMSRWRLKPEQLGAQAVIDLQKLESGLFSPDPEEPTSAKDRQALVAALEKARRSSQSAHRHDRDPTRLYEH